MSKNAVAASPDHWTWRTGLTQRPTLNELDRWLVDTQAPRIAEGKERSAVRAIAEENARLRSVLGHCPKAIAVLDEEGILTGYNLEFCALFGEAPELGRPIASYFDATDAKMLAEVIKAAGTEQRTAALLQMSAGDDGAREIEFLVATLPWVDDRSIGVVLAGDDRTSLLREQSERAFEREAMEEQSRRGVYTMAQAVLMEDIATAHAAALAAVQALTAPERRSRSLGDEEVAQLLSSAQEAIQAGAAILERTRGAKRSSSGESSDLRECAQRAARLTPPLRARHRVYLDVRVPEGVRVRVGAPELTQVLTQVLSTALAAVRDAERPGTIDLTVESTSDTVTIRVRDDGIGIEPSRLAASFDPAAATLGLAVARRLVEAAGGRVRALSEVDRGTELVIDLPRATDS